MATRRGLLHLSALVANCSKADFKAKYEQCITAGKAPKQVFIAFMRKIVILANALLKKGRKWQ